MPSYIGIDPGVKGAVARIILPGWETDVWPMPETPADLAVLLRGEKEWLEMVVVERVAAFGRKNQSERGGAMQTFGLGRSFGRIEGILATLGVRHVTVLPQAWQKAIGCQTGGDKHVSKARAQEFFPGVHVTLQNADALLIARYCAEHYGFERVKPGLD